MAGLSHKYEHRRPSHAYFSLPEGVARALLIQFPNRNQQLTKRSVMISKVRNNKAAFTLVEIMIVVAIIGLLAALAIPGFVKARKQSQGRRIINDARQMDAAIDQWALEKGMKDGDTVVTSEAATYLKTAWSDTDLLNNPYTIGSVGTGQVQISATTKSALAGVGIDWGPY
jgi:prepilin-type N-terminal cleavage/methylation domain-containing protein